ncbi:response regulator [Candidatus Peribacteria bacterium]|nr:response regulator [Candidatus Peribacteria bacterium]
MPKEKNPTAKAAAAPAAPDTTTPAVKDTKVTDKPAGKGKRVLIIEDERPLAHALALKMGHEGYETQMALNGAEGLKEVGTGKYDIILLDLIMPEIDGFTILQEMQAKHVKTPVIILSNLGQGEDRERAKKLGAVEYFVKANTPIAEILKKVKEML